MNNMHLITYLLAHGIVIFFLFNFLPKLYITSILMNVLMNLIVTYIMHYMYNFQLILIFFFIIMLLLLVLLLFLVHLQNNLLDLL